MTFWMALGLMLAPMALAQDGQFGVVSGRVVNAKTGEPVRKASVAFSRAGRPNEVYGATSSADGTFRVTQIPPGTYSVSAERQGFAGLQQRAGTATMVTVVAGQEVKGREVKLMPHAVITGRVLDEDGDPVVGAHVEAAQRRTAAGRSQWGSLRSTQTNDLGEFRLHGLRPGRYTVVAAVVDQNLDERMGARRNREKPPETYLVTYHPSATDAASAQLVDVAAGQLLPGVEVQLRKTRVYRVTGTVSSEGRNCRTLEVAAVRRGKGTYSPPLHAIPQVVRQDGTFELPGVAPGTYTILAVCGTEQGPSQSGRAAVDVVSTLR